MSTWEAFHIKTDMKPNQTKPYVLKAPLHDALSEKNIRLYAYIVSYVCMS